MTAPANTPHDPFTAALFGGEPSPPARTFQQEPPFKDRTATEITTSSIASKPYPFVVTDDVSPIELDDLPEIVVPQRVTGNGIIGIRGWVCAVSQHYDPMHDRALVQYATWLGYYAHLNTFRVEITDRDLAEQLGTSRTRFAGHHRRLVDDGFLIKIPKKRGETGTTYVLSTLVEL